MKPEDPPVNDAPPGRNRPYNRLIYEKSPYLLQHAGNPVDWYPWGDEVFARAAWEDKPVFLSIGYATSHWCHVMAHESFEDPEVAALMNEAFIGFVENLVFQQKTKHILTEGTVPLLEESCWILLKFTPPFGRGKHPPDRPCTLR